LLGQYLSLLHYRRQCRPWDEIISNVWIGRKLSNREAEGAVRSGVTAVLDLSAESSEAKAFRAISYRNIPILDLTAPSLEQLWEMGKFIAEHSETGIVYVHCKIGYSRSAAAVAAYLMIHGKVSDAEEATTMIRRARPSIVIRPEIVSALSHFEHRLGRSLVDR
jgi:protein-tyrosine phosphatase